MTDPTVPLATLVLGLVAIVVMTKGRIGEITSPFSLTILTCLSIFAIRPLLQIYVTDEYTFYGHSARAGFNSAALVGFLFLVSVICGYALHVPRTPRVRAILAAERARNTSVLSVVVAAIAFTGAWFLTMTLVGGGPAFLGELFSGRSDQIARRLSNVPNLVWALPTSAGVALSWHVMNWREQGILTKSQYIAIGAAFIATTVPPLSLGVRRFLLPTILSMAIALVWRNRNRRVKASAIVVVVTTVLFLAAIPYVRSAGSRGDTTSIGVALQQYVQEEGLVGSFQSYFISYDTDMFDFVAVLSDGETLPVPLGLGRALLGDVVLSAFPAALQPVELYSDQVLMRLQGFGCNRRGCPVASLPGVAFYDGSWLFVGLVGLGTGLLTREYQRFVLSRLPPSLTALTGVSFAIILVRGNTPNVLWIALNVLAASAALRYLASRSDWLSSR